MYFVFGYRSAHSFDIKYNASLLYSTIKLLLRLPLNVRYVTPDSWLRFLIREWFDDNLLEILYGGIAV